MTKKIFSKEEKDENQNQFSFVTDHRIDDPGSLWNRNARSHSNTHC